MRKTLLVTISVVIALLLAACEPGDPFGPARPKATTPGPAAVAAAQPAVGVAPAQPAPAAQQPPPAPSGLVVPISTRAEKQLSGKGDGATLNHAAVLRDGTSTIINWGYGAWGELGVVYPKINPGGQVPKGPSQLVTHFNGRNWVSEGEWAYTLPAYSEVLAVTQGDAPLKVEISGNTLRMRSDQAIRDTAPASMDNVPETTGSIGTSLVVFVR